MSEERLRRSGLDEQYIENLRYCRCGMPTENFVLSVKGDAPELASLNEIITPVADAIAVAAYEKWRDLVDFDQ